MSNGQVATECHEVDNSCNYGCSPSDIRYKCKSGQNSYVLWNCGPTFGSHGNDPGCARHFYSGSHTCDECCLNKNCCSGMPKCFP